MRAKLFVEEPAGGGEQEAQVTNASSATNDLIPTLGATAVASWFSFNEMLYDILVNVNKMIMNLLYFGDDKKQNAFIDIVFNVWPI